MKRRRKQNRSLEAVPVDQPAPEATPALDIGTADIPAHVRAILAEAGAEAAERLLDLLKGPAFKTFAPTAQRSIIELALTRAYGLPVKRSVDVSLSSDDADAVAASLSALQASLPERGAQARTVNPEAIEVPDSDPSPARGRQYTQ